MPKTVLYDTDALRSKGCHVTEFVIRTATLPTGKWQIEFIKRMRAGDVLVDQALSGHESIPITTVTGVVRSLEDALMRELVITGGVQLALPVDEG